MPFWQDLIRSWEGSWEAAGLDPFPKVALTPPNQAGDLTLQVFPLLKVFRGNTAALTEAVLAPLSSVVVAHELIKGFLNVHLTPDFWAAFLSEARRSPEMGYTHLRLGCAETILFEYPSPNTNKPLHLGHLRNLALGQAVSALWERLGAKVIRVNLVNDRGIHISKSMLGWQHFFSPATPQTASKKGDHFVGDCYVAFEKAYKAQVDALARQGLPPEEALVQAPLFVEAQALLQRWEENDPDVRRLWQTMNSWVYEGFDQTFARLGVRFDKVYYESETYQLGKAVVEEGLAKGIFYRSEDGAVWADLSDLGLGRKALLRRDGTSLYITQDLGTADLKLHDYPMLTRSVYVIGNEQDHHMRVLIALLKRLGRPYAEAIYHLSYGMVELPTGRMKTREGTVVDADDLLDEMKARALELLEENIPAEEREVIAEGIGQAAIRFYLLRVEPVKNIVFDPQASIELQGLTGPFLQYGYVRALRLRQKALELGYEAPPAVTVPATLLPAERALLTYLYALPAYLEGAALRYDPSTLAHYGYELTQRYNEFYQQIPVLKAETEDLRNFRLALSETYEIAICAVLEALCIPVVEQM